MNDSNKRTQPRKRPVPSPPGKDEGKLPHGYTSDDKGNYGTGGYYGNTYRQETYDAERSQPNGYPDHYRFPGDRRYDTDPRRAWDSELPTRKGYRAPEERVRMGKRKNKGIRR